MSADEAFEVATITGSYLRMLLTGASGSGKTLTALKIAAVLSERKVCVIDTESNTARLYANEPDVPKPYYVKNLTKFRVANYLKYIEEAYNAGADVCIVDSITPAWNKKDGILEHVGSNMINWGKIGNPEYFALVDALTTWNDRMHIIATARSKMQYELSTNAVTGKLDVVAKGLEPIQRQELPYEFDIVGDIDKEHHVISFNGVGKLRCTALDGKSFEKPGKELGLILKAWLNGNGGFER